MLVARFRCQPAIEAVPQTVLAHSPPPAHNPHPPLYSTCLFCNTSLGTNESIESFPVGRRLAFDQRRGRLWIVCRKCEKWNLTPLEERWEAIEECERLFRDTRKRVSTDEIGLARLAEGLDLVRIGEPQRPEFAAWRYGDQFGRRRRNALVKSGAGITVAAGATVLMVANMVNPLTGALGLVAPWLVNALSLQDLLVSGLKRRRAVARVGPRTATVVVRGAFVEAARLVPAAEPDGWGIEVPVEGAGGRRRVTMVGAEARRVAARVVPVLTPQGGTPDQVRDAVGRIESAGDAERYLRWLARNRRTRRDYMRRKDIVTGLRVAPSHEYDTLGVQGLEACLAVEMAVNEENERMALESEIAMLEDAWREAEEIAAIADGLALPGELEEQLAALKRPTRS